ncbi:hypothetical protein ACNQVK_02685 [Mycobacterium sp. 134]|uniref:hypothetical protein n=1 Tax=Mycobacterium sp. 134 TaxID=3400425 RepID=UPI003AAB4028
MLTGNRVETGIFGSSCADGSEVLQAIRAIAVRVLAYATPAELETIIPADLLQFYERDHPQLPTAQTRSTTKQLTIRSPRPASLTAVGVVAALHCLQRDDVQSAGHAMRWLITAMRKRKAQPCTTNLLWSGGVTKAVQLAALGPTLKPSDQLRYRTATSSPAVPTRKSADIRRLARRMPASLWQAWSLPLSIPGCHHRQLRSALAVVVLLVGTRATLDFCVRTIRSSIDGHGVSRILQLLERHADWHDINCAINAVADHLSDVEVPIDYHRRRELDYGSLLPDKSWRRICRDTDTASQGPARATVARHYLYQRVSGSTVESQAISAALRTKIANFPYHLTPELADELDEHAVEFLASQGVRGEPIHYEPSTECFRGLQLPGDNPDDADIDSLHHHVRKGLTLGDAATQIGVELEVARYLLTRFPAPVEPNGEHGAYYRAKHAYPRSQFIDRYQTQGKSLRDMANELGVSRQTMVRLADEYDLDLRKPGRSPKKTIEREWLYTEYVTHGRPLPDLAREQGVSTSTMARWAQTHGIPLRPRGGARGRVGPST